MYTNTRTLTLFALIMIIFVASDARNPQNYIQNLKAEAIVWAEESTAKPNETPTSMAKVTDATRYEL